MVKYDSLLDIYINNQIVFYNEDRENVAIILDIFNGNIPMEEPDKLEPLICYYIGLYYQHDIKDYNMMSLYYLSAIDRQNSRAMNSMALYCKNILKDDIMSEKYLMMGVELGNYRSMFHMGTHCMKNNNIPMMISYYEMAFENGCVESITNLATYYQSIREFELMEKYYLMGIEKKYILAMKKLSQYYFDIDSIKSTMYNDMAVKQLFSDYVSGEICYTSQLLFNNTILAKELKRLSKICEEEENKKN
jgi:hypothetical protein